MSGYNLENFRPINFLFLPCNINGAALTTTPLMILCVLLLFDIEVVKFIFLYYRVYYFQTHAILFW